MSANRQPLPFLHLMALLSLVPSSTSYIAAAQSSAPSSVQMPQTTLTRAGSSVIGPTPSTTRESSATTGLSEPFRWNAGLNITSIHASNTGWATLATPSIGYRFNDIFSIDATLPIYFFRLAETRSAKPRHNIFLINQRGELADVVLSGHAQLTPHSTNYQITGAVTAPTGDEAYGLTSGRVTFDISNQFDRTFGRFTPLLEIGGGDSSTLVNRLVTKTYTSLGPLAHFETGLAVDLTRRISFEADAYEQLPIGDQKIYTSKVTKKKITTVVTGHNVTEDNGFNAALDLVLDRHTVFSSYYSRSLRLHTDTVGVGITRFLRSEAPSTEAAPIDQLIR